jgi:hypothetical protein
MHEGWLFDPQRVRPEKPVGVWSQVCLDEHNREHVRSVLGWVEGERKGHFPDIDSAQIQYRIATSFLLDTFPCIVFGRRPPQCTSLRLDDTHVSVQHPAFTVLEVLCVFCLIYGTGAFQC